LINLQQLERILGAVLVEVGVVEHILHSIVFFLRTRTGLASHSGWKTSRMKLVASSFGSSFLMASCRSSAKQRRCCHLGQL
jgi:hypothetical protein